MNEIIQKNIVFAISFYALTLLALPLHSSPVQAADPGPYSVSAHGDAGNGVSRTEVPSPYAIGNCVHCHEQHASLEGSEPTATGGPPSPYALFASFDETEITNPYEQSDNFCFYCHTGGTDAASLQSGGVIENEDYATTFGSSTLGSPTGILEAFNSDYYHNLYDIWRFSKDQSTFNHFTSATNPCMACHNPHLAKRNREFPSNPNYTAISLPTNHDSLWGDNTSQRMDKYDYQPPVINLNGTYEPRGSSSMDSSLTPDYNTFCGDCHNTNLTVPSTTLGTPSSPSPGRDLFKIDWSDNESGDRHGQRAATDTHGRERDIASPYSTSYTAPHDNYTLSCLDCHEPHGSPNSFIIRRAVNGKPPNRDIVFTATPPTNTNIILTATGLATSPAGTNPYMKDLCISCHTALNKDIHHGANPDNLTDGAPYKAENCDRCHVGQPIQKIICEQCHFHGSIVEIPANEGKSGVAETRRTF